MHLSSWTPAGQTKVLAGGTDLVLALKGKTIAPTCVLDINERRDARAGRAAIVRRAAVSGIPERPSSFSLDLKSVRETGAISSAEASNRCWLLVEPDDRSDHPHHGRALRGVGSSHGGRSGEMPRRPEALERVAVTHRAEFHACHTGSRPSVHHQQGQTVYDGLLEELARNEQIKHMHLGLGM